MGHWSRRSNENHWNLMPLTPEYIEEEHGVYVVAINEAFENSKIMNIALSGSYGVGKSSILQKLVEKHKDRVVNLSLSTLAPIKDSIVDNSVPKQATTTTNRIQQEIVKQLLYREQPTNMPGSRFQRIERFNFWREVVIAGLASLVLFLFLLATGLVGIIQSEVTQLQSLGVWIHPIILCIEFLVVIVARKVFHGRIHIRQLSAGSATVTLDGNSVSYFDQYLDEIVYFFEVSERNIVIFEDFDRFDDSRIFETLLSLNTLLNESPQIKSRIRFVYAIKDSIFDKLELGSDGQASKESIDSIKDPSLAETVMANRTKFFDLVIPVVPFITHRSARNLTLQVLKRIDHQVDSDLIDLAARHVPDMRLLKNICNEFVISRDRIFSGDGQGLLLSETELFAMMLYKSTHLSDFERIRIGKSNIDQLYGYSRSLVSSNLGRVQGEVRTIRNRLRYIDEITALSSLLGDRFIAHVERTARAFDWHGRQGEYLYEGVVIDEGKLKKTEFWNEFVNEPGQALIEWRHKQNYNIRLTFAKSDLVEPLRNNLEPGSWNQAEREELSEELEEKNFELKFLRGADIGDLISHSEYKEKYEGTDQSLEVIARQILTDELAFQLARSGYLNRNFTLYTATFHGDRVSPDATNFIIHNLERGVMDIHFELKGEDVDAVVREWGRKALQDTAFYNISVLDHLLENEVSSADIMIKSLSQFGNEQIEFSQAFLESTKNRERFVSRLTLISSNILIFLVELVTLNKGERASLLSVALGNLVERISYKTNQAVSEYLFENYRFIDALQSSLSLSKAESIAKVFLKADVKIDELVFFSEDVKRAFIRKSLYYINRNNLSVVLDSENHALDIAMSTDKSIYEYLLGNLDIYLSEMNEDSSTVVSNERFIHILEDVLSKDPELLGQIVMGSSPECLVTDLDMVSIAVWPALAYNLKFPAAFHNISRYVREIGSVDASLARLLGNAKVLSDVDTVDETDKHSIAIAILDATETIESPITRARAVESLILEQHLDFESISPEVGPLFSLLVEKGIVEDTFEVYEYLSSTDWSTRELFIDRSANFLEFVTPGLIRDDLSSMLASESISLPVKRHFCSKADDYFLEADKDDCIQLSSFATSNGFELPAVVVERMAEVGVPSQDVIHFLSSHMKVIERTLLFRILGLLDGDYPQLVSVGWEIPKIINSSANIELLERLKDLGIVKTYKFSGNIIRVNKRRK